MDKPIDQNSSFWTYLSQTQKDLILEGQYLMDDIIRDHAYQFKDYSFLIFPFAKTYEGFLKQIFKDAKLISHLDYISDHLRLGKLMSPNLAERLGDRSLYLKLVNISDLEFAENVWQAWELGRNQILHYFPHNIKAVSFSEAQTITDNILNTMKMTYEKLNPNRYDTNKTIQS